MPDSIAVLRHAADAVRSQIPTGGLTLASVKELLAAADAVCGESSRPAPRRAQSSARQAKRQEARSRWAKIAQENADPPEGEVTT